MNIILYGSRSSRQRAAKWHPMGWVRPVPSWQPVGSRVAKLGQLRAGGGRRNVRAARPTRAGYSASSEGSGKGGKGGTTFTTFSTSQPRRLVPGCWTKRSPPTIRLAFFFKYQPNLLLLMYLPSRIGMSSSASCNGPPKTVSNFETTWRTVTTLLPNVSCQTFRRWPSASLLLSSSTWSYNDWAGSGKPSQINGCRQ